ncbi:hypothetical protein JCM17960_22270 [Magnetospira thiophila]
MGLKEWVPIQSRLSELFSGGTYDVVGGKRLAPVVDAERVYGEFLVNTYHGFDVLIRAFLDFYIETLEVAWANSAFGQLPEKVRSYSIVYLHFLSAFRRFRAADVLWCSGYTFAGYSLLRDLKDLTIHLGAIANGEIHVLELLGIDPANPDEQVNRTGKEYKKRKENAKKVRTRAMCIMVGKQSGLDEADQAELKLWRDLFHEELHSARFSSAEDSRIIFGEGRRPPFGPEPHEENRDAAMYMNRAVEIGWMLLRTFPFLQVQPRAFGEEWAEKWELLDTAFRMQVTDLAEIGKFIGEVIPRLIEKRFAHSPDTCYAED